MTAPTKCPAYQSDQWRRAMIRRIGRNLARRQATRPIDRMAEHGKPEVAADVAATVVGLISLRVEGGEVPRAIRALLPDPLGSLEDWQRFSHSDLDAMTAAARSAEAWRIRVALARTDPEFVPEWALDRLSRLEAVA